MAAALVDRDRLLADEAARHLLRAVPVAGPEVDALREEAHLEAADRVAAPPHDEQGRLPARALLAGTERALAVAGGADVVTGILEDGAAAVEDDPGAGDAERVVAVGVVVAAASGRGFRRGRAHAQRDRRRSARRRRIRPHEQADVGRGAAVHRLERRTDVVFGARDEARGARLRAARRCDAVAGVGRDYARCPDHARHQRANDTETARHSLPP